MMELMLIFSITGIPYTLFVSLRQSQEMGLEYSLQQGLADSLPFIAPIILALSFLDRHEIISINFYLVLILSVGTLGLYVYLPFSGITETTMMRYTKWKIAQDRLEGRVDASGESLTKAKLINGRKKVKWMVPLYVFLVMGIFLFEKGVSRLSVSVAGFIFLFICAICNYSTRNSKHYWDNS